MQPDQKLQHPSSYTKVLASIPQNDWGTFIEKEENDDMKLTSSPTKILRIGYVPEDDLFSFEGYTKLLEKNISWQNEVYAVPYKVSMM